SIFKSGELKIDSVIKDFLITAADGKIYKTKHYSLDAIISVGYRVNSIKATQFRIWATKIIHSYIVQGFTVNKSRIAQNYNAFFKAVQDVKALLPKDSAVDTESILELVTMFADTWLSLSAYDKDELVVKGKTKKRVTLTAQKLIVSLAELKSMLIVKDQATDLFGTERVRGGIEGIVGTVMQTFGGKELYPTVEEKAAHLLYFIVKNHVFLDGNKRSGAYAFIWFLRSARMLDITRMTPPALTAITLLIAESQPKEKEKMIGLVIAMLSKNK
ncbi:MAG: virulence protein RhuM/Fic/DOC family protein, partial [Patescibacteria group bacterium]